MRTVLATRLAAPLCVPQPVRAGPAWPADVLRELGIPARFLALCAAVERLGLAGLTRGPDDEIAPNELIPGGAPRGTSFVHRPDDAVPGASGAENDRRLAPNGFHVTRG